MEYKELTINKNYIYKGKILSVRKDDVKLINDMGCSVCDMEAGAIAQVCTSNNLPFIAIKGISDVHGSGVQEEQFYKNLSAVGNGFPDIILKVLETL